VEIIEDVARRSATDLANGLAVVRDRVDAEFRTAERYDAKVRQALAIASGFFVVAQASAFANFGYSGVTSSERLLILATALLTAGSLAVTAVRAYCSEDLQEEEAMKPQSVFALLQNRPEDGMASAYLIFALGEVAERRVQGNYSRAVQVKRVFAAAQLTLALSVVELVVALVARV
jgi:hypothetical protein